MHSGIRKPVQPCPGAGLWVILDPSTDEIYKTCPSECQASIQDSTPAQFSTWGSD